MDTKYFYTDKIESIFLCTKVIWVGIVSMLKINLKKITDRVRNDPVRNDRGLEMIVNQLRHSLQSKINL